MTEIEMTNGSLSLKVFKALVEDFEELDRVLHEDFDMFELEPETPGFHDVEFTDFFTRGYYSGIVPLKSST